MLFTPPSNDHYSLSLRELPLTEIFGIRLRQTWVVFAIAVFLVSVPVFFQAPLVRVAPWVSLDFTLVWLGGALLLCSRESMKLWGDLLIGFTLTWLAGSIYWGWLRWEPFLHLPIEAIGLPIALWWIWQRKNLVGSWFYVGSLFGTVITDLYFYLVNLIPYWRKLMVVEPEFARSILRQAVLQVQTPLGLTFAAILLGVLFFVGCLPLRSVRLHRWAFGGAVLSTVLVDGLFWIAATAA